MPRLRELYAQHRHRRLVEPFVGGMSVALGLQPERALLADVNFHLINFYCWLKQGFTATLSMENDEVFYYEKRKRFNDLVEAGLSREVELSELFYYLNRTCFNGLCRFNKSGGFNVPFGKYKTINYRIDFSEYAPVLSRWDILQSHFRDLEVDSEDFVYLDPPYDGTFTDYSTGGFSWEEQEQLARIFAEHSGPVVVSNQATDRIVALYSQLGYNVELIEAPRRISANGNRKKAMEMLAYKNLQKVVDVYPVYQLNTLLTHSKSTTKQEKQPQEENEMAYLPTGFGSETAKVEATIPRERLKDGDYIFVHKTLFVKNTQKGEAIIIEHKIIEAKPLVAGIEPTPVGTTWGHFLPRYGKAAVMCKPNLKAYALGILGPAAKKLSEEELGVRIDAMGGPQQEARGMLVRGITFHTEKKEDGEDFMGMNWYPVPNENEATLPSVIKRRADLDAMEGAPDVTGSASNGASAAPNGAPPPFTSPSAGAPPAFDPLVGWTAYPGKPGWFYKGQEVKSEVDLRAGK